jgi:hypothetical protein
MVNVGYCRKAIRFTNSRRRHRGDASSSRQFTSHYSPAPLADDTQKKLDL